MLELGQGNPKKKVIDKSISQHFSILRLVREGQPGSVSLRRNGSLRRNLWSSRGFVGGCYPTCGDLWIRPDVRFMIYPMLFSDILDKYWRHQVAQQLDPRDGQCFFGQWRHFWFCCCEGDSCPLLFIGYSSVPYLAGVAELIPCFLLWLQTLSNGKVGRKRTTITGLNLWMAVGLWAAALLYLAETFGFPSSICFAPPK
jgi:hypothetical protein